MKMPVTGLSAILSFVLVPGLLTPAVGESPASPAQEADFVSLFDGKTLEGWHVMNGGQFEADNGVIKLNGGRGWLRSEKQYGDFVLKLEVRWLKPKQDSGIFLRATKEGDNWPKQRYEVQCENSRRVARLFGAKHQRDIKKAYGALKDVGQWNTFEIHCSGSHCRVKFNGKWVTRSKDLKRPKGYIGFQGEGGLLEFRKIRLKTLQADPGRQN